MNGVMIPSINNLVILADMFNVDVLGVIVCRDV